MSIFVSLLSVFTYLFVLIPVYRFSFRFYLYYIFICFNCAISTFVLLYLHSFHFICIYAISICVYFTFINIHFILICSVLYYFMHSTLAVFIPHIPISNKTSYFTYFHRHSFQYRLHSNRIHIHSTFTYSHSTLNPMLYISIPLPSAFPLHPFHFYLHSLYIHSTSIYISSTFIPLSSAFPLHPFHFHLHLFHFLRRRLPVPFHLRKCNRRP